MTNTTTELPVIKKVSGTFIVYAPDGRYIASVECEHFMKQMLIAMFGLSEFDSIPLTEADKVDELHDEYRLQQHRARRDAYNNQN